MNKDRSRLKRLGRWTRLQVIRMVREDSTPARTGLGFALGAFIGIFPSFAVGTPLAFIIAGRLGWNRAAAAAGTFLTNPLTAPMFFSLSAWLGFGLLGLDMKSITMQGVIENLRHFGLAFLLGNTIVALSFSALLGFTLFFIVRHRGQAGLRRMVMRTRPVYSPPTTPVPPQ